MRGATPYLTGWLLPRLASGILLVMTFFAPASKAGTISFEVANPSLTTSSGGTVTFIGTITNDSDVDLNASSFFFIFFGFDPAAVTVVQDLGITTDFPIPNGTTSAATALFDATLGDVSEGSSFPIQAQLADVNFDASSPQTVTVSAGTPVSNVPEPSALFLLCAGLAVLAGSWMRQSR